MAVDGQLVARTVGELRVQDDADERERAADESNHLADERERAADARDRTARDYE
jgi:hypothetical protein